MKYTSPSVQTMTMEDVLSKLGPARALMYAPAGGGDSSRSGSSSSSSSSRSDSGSC